MGKRVWVASLGPANDDISVKEADEQTGVSGILIDEERRTRQRQ